PAGGRPRLAGLPPQTPLPPRPRPPPPHRQRGRLTVTPRHPQCRTPSLHNTASATPGTINTPVSRDSTATRATDADGVQGRFEQYGDAMVPAGGRTGEGRRRSRARTGAGAPGRRPHSALSRQRPGSAACLDGSMVPAAGHPAGLRADGPPAGAGVKGARRSSDPRFDGRLRARAVRVPARARPARLRPHRRALAGGRGDGTGDRQPAPPRRGAPTLLSDLILSDTRTPRCTATTDWSLTTYAQSRNDAPAQPPGSGHRMLCTPPPRCRALPADVVHRVESTVRASGAVGECREFVHGREGRSGSDGC
ncbi:hypothetical protein OK006_11000, partial [Actinobacteria bacterium OK006]